MMIHRFWGLLAIRAKLIKHDIAWQHITERSRYGPVGVVGETDQSILSEYLLNGEDASSSHSLHH
jgi:hypothetical protein